MPMKKRFRLINRGERGGQFYCVDSETGQRFSLKTKDRDTAEQIVLAKNQALRHPLQHSFGQIGGQLTANSTSSPSLTSSGQIPAWAPTIRWYVSRQG